MSNVVRGSAYLLIRGKTTIPELRKKYGNEVTQAILSECKKFLDIDRQVQEWAQEGVIPWKIE